MIRRANRSAIATCAVLGIIGGSAIAEESALLQQYQAAKGRMSASRTITKENPPAVPAPAISASTAPIVRLAEPRVQAPPVGRSEISPLKPTAIQSAFFVAPSDGATNDLSAAAFTAEQPKEEEHLAPIVPAWAVPRPGTRKLQIVKTHVPAAPIDQPTATTAPGAPLVSEEPRREGVVPTADRLPEVLTAREPNPPQLWRSASVEVSPAPTDQQPATVVTEEVKPIIKVLGTSELSSKPLSGQSSGVVPASIEKPAAADSPSFGQPVVLPKAQLNPFMDSNDDSPVRAYLPAKKTESAAGPKKSANQTSSRRTANKQVTTISTTPE